jgi:hypothetical protein
MYVRLLLTSYISAYIFPWIIFSGKVQEIGNVQNFVTLATGNKTVHITLLHSNPGCNISYVPLRFC